MKQVAGLHHGAFGMAAFIVAWFSPIPVAQSAEVLIKMSGTDVSFRGELLGFDQDSFTVNLEDLGPMRLARSRFTCVEGACPGAAPPQLAKTSLGPDFGVYGSNTIGAKLMPSLIAGYAGSIGASAIKNAGAQLEEAEFDLLDSQGRRLAKVDLKSHGSGTSFPALARGDAHIGMSSRQIRDQEETFMGMAGYPRMRGPGQEHVLALDGLMVIVAPDNPLNGITMEDLARVFSGEISDWSDLGQEPGPINLYARDDKSGTLDTFSELVLEPANARLSPEADRYESNAKLADEVAADSLGIGFTGIANQRNAKALAIVTSCGMEQTPSIFNIKTEEYPLARRLYLYSTTSLIAPHGRELLRYALSDQAQGIVSDAGFIDQEIDRLPFAAQGDRIARGLNGGAEDFDLGLMRRATAELSNAERLSTTLRFKFGSTYLDNKAQQDLRRLAGLLERDAYRERQILLVGFTDSSGDGSANLQLSRQRAAQARGALEVAAGRKLPTSRVRALGYGELLPVACNDTRFGRGMNRRVEVWLR